MTVRGATDNDVDAVCRVARRAWEADYPEILTRETVEKGVEVWYATDQIRKELEQEETVLLVAERDDKVVGFAHAALSETGEEGFILRIYVHPDHRREHVGSELLERVCAELVEEAVDRVYAMVLTENEPGNAFYSQFGFQAEGERETTIGSDSYPERRYVLEDLSTLGSE